ncbi:glycosyltransferase family 4 protein [Vibrio sp. Vb2535]|uniref:glycosyltransferase family 4 protein n=1 Tax=Vibrio TaxID=662 RepID=UPI002964A06B|nr:glycosyltransferase family 4 protein [Vibrio sp. Vb2535]MDW1755880.1 glycosyltransferase family 4 protein [Vibrio sp. Vb2535]
MSIKVIYVINSIVNKPGNIGFRIGKIIEASPEENNAELYARDGKVENKYVLCHTMGPFGHIARALNALKIYLFPNVKIRVIDIKIFEIFFFFSYLLNKKKWNKFDNKIAHVVETSPFIIRLLKNNGFKIIQDVPIAPISYLDTFDLREAVLKDIYNQYYDRKLDSLERESYRLADIINVPSSYVKKQLEYSGVPNYKIRLIEFGADEVETRCSISRKGPDEGIDFVFAGQVSARKGIEYLLRAWDCPDFAGDRLHLCGRLRPEISESIKSKKFKNIVTPGFVNTYEYLPRCDVYVFPSIWEGSSKSIYEGMASGLPVITTDESGSIIKDNLNGFIIPKCNHIELRKKMLWFKNNFSKIEEMGLVSLKEVKKYTWPRYVSRCLELYKQV